MLRPAMTVKSAAPGLILLAILVVFIPLLVRAAIFNAVSNLLRAGCVVLVLSFLLAAGYIVRDLLKRKHQPRSVSSIATILTGATGILTVIALLLGMRNSSDPKSLFGAFYVFISYFACAIWALQARIADTELVAREQSLRVEYRLADLAERLKK